MNFHDIVAEDFAAVNQMIVDELHSDVGLVENIGHYIVEGGGKRIRPLMVLLAAMALNYRGAEHIRMATIIEFIHTATLLHDDVVDTSTMRRGRDTANAVWGNSPTVLVGDFLYSRAFQMMVQLKNLQIMNIMADTTNAIAEGEVQQLVNAGNPQTTEETYYQTIYKKTAILFEAAARTGALIAGGSDAMQNALAAYGKHLGMAFQLQDDVLDYAGASDDLGKNVGDDLAEGKPTLPLIHAMATGPEETKKLIENAIKNADSSQLQDVIAAVNTSGSIQYATHKAAEHSTLARNSLTNLPPSEYRDTLIKLADFSTSRSF
jgi:octaprenyl-diphosphate synthase